MKKPELFTQHRGNVVLTRHDDGTVTHRYDPPDAAFFVVTRATMDMLLAGVVVSKGPTPHAPNGRPG